MPVRVSLSCGWCAQQVPDVAGRMETTVGRLQIVSAPSPLRVSAGRPVCPRCGGPLFVENWKVIRQALPIATDKSDEDADSREERTAA